MDKLCTAWEKRYIPDAWEFKLGEYTAMMK